MSSRWNRLARPWSRGTIVIVTALVTAVVTLVISGYDANTATVPSPTERSWVEVAATPFDAVDDHGLTGPLDEYFPESHEALPDVYAFQPSGDRYRGAVAAVPAGHYELYAACVFKEDVLLADAGAYLTVFLYYGDQQEEALEFTVECGLPAYPIGQEMAEDTDFAVTTVTWFVGLLTADIGPDMFTAQVNGESVDATNALRLVFVPKVE